jgi:hypothetical protein
MTYRSLLVGLAALALVACGGPGPAPTPSSSPTTIPSTSPPAPACAKPAPVYHPTRLALRGICQLYQGVVLEVLNEADGDHHIWISPDPGYEHFLNSMNRIHGQPALVAEIVPACTTEPADSSAAARCPASALQEPKVGDHLYVQGPWVTDTIHGWNEIHPVTNLQELPKSPRHLLYPSPNAFDLVNGE